MYDDITLQQIQDDLLNAVSEEMDKRPSSLIYAVCAAAAPYFAMQYLEMDYVNDQSYASTADREHLILLAKDDAAITPKDATNTIVKGKFNLAIDQGTRFAVMGSDYKFYTTEPCELNSDGFYYAKMTCETAGNLPNDDFLGACTPIDVSGDVIEIKGLTTCEIVEILVQGEDEEDTEVFRKRYLSERKWEHYGGNIADYEIMMSRETGVGDCKVIPKWDGGGTVKLVLVDPENKPCSEEFVNQIKESIDPTGLEGKGYGKAPIDHIVTVVSAEPTNINIAFTLTYVEGQSWATLGDKIKAAIESYFDSVRQKWKASDKSPLIIRVAYIESAVLDVEGIVDITGTTLNGQDANVEVPPYNVPMVGTVSAK